MKTDTAATQIAKIIIGLGIVGMIFWKTPLVEIFYLFIYVVLIPVSFLVGLGLIGSGTINFLLDRVDGLRERVEGKMKFLRAQKAQQEAN